MNPVFALKMLQEKYKEKKKDLHMIFVDLEKAYDVQCSQIFDMVSPEKESDSRRVRECDAGHVQRN